MARALAVAVGVLVLAVLAACGGGGSEPEGAEPEAWVDDVCTSVTSWRDDVQAAGTEIQSSVAGSSNLEDARSQLVAFLGDAVDRTDELLADIEAAGTPAVEDGEAISADLQGVLGDLRQVFEDARADAEALPTDDPAAFAGGATDLATSIGDGVEEVGQTFDELDSRYDDEDLEAAFNENESCNALG